MKQFLMIVITFLIGSLGLSSPKQSDIRTVYLNSKNTAFLSEQVNAATAEKDIAHTLYKRVTLSPQQTLYVVIPSLGGETDHAYALAQVLSLIPNVELICKYCGSAAGAIFELTPHKRLVMAKSEMVMHEMYCPHFTARDITKKNLDDIQKSSDDFNKIFYTKLKMSKKAYEDKIARSEWTPSGEEIVKLGLADELVKISCDEHVRTILPDTCTP